MTALRKYHGRFQAPVRALGLVAAITCGCDLTGGGSTSATSVGDGDDSGDDGGTTGAGSASGGASATAATSLTGGLTGATSLTTTGAGSADDGADATGITTLASGTESAGETGPASCQPNPDDSPCEMCLGLQCCAELGDCTDVGSDPACSCHSACIEEGYPAECSLLCGPAPAEFDAVFACANDNCAAECGL